MKIKPFSQNLSKFQARELGRAAASACAKKCVSKKRIGERGELKFQREADATIGSWTRLKCGPPIHRGGGGGFQRWSSRWPEPW